MAYVFEDSLDALLAARALILVVDRAFRSVEEESAPVVRERPSFGPHLGLSQIDGRVARTALAKPLRGVLCRDVALNQEELRSVFLSDANDSRTVIPRGVGRVDDHSDRPPAGELHVSKAMHLPIAEIANAFAVVRITQNVSSYLIHLKVRCSHIEARLDLACER
ncbi:MAG: hypothetical protein P1T08_06565 [Acidimicrobiia bacterium]|nr:hypothetical protein [Acidimicrobiia bacterium]